jgi:hypothetical protein
VIIEHPVDLAGDLVTLAQEVAQAVGQWGRLLSAAVPGTVTGLLDQTRQDLLDQPSPHTRGARSDDLDEFGATGFVRAGQAAAARQQFQHGRVLHLRAQHTSERRVDLGEQAADAVGNTGDLASEVTVVADQHLQLGEGFVTGADSAQPVRQGAGGVGNDVAVAGVSLRGAGV